jgi:hypothetical protein
MKKNGQFTLQGTDIAAGYVWSAIAGLHSRYLLHLCHA